MKITDEQALRLLQIGLEPQPYTTVWSKGPGVGAPENHIGDDEDWPEADWTESDKWREFPYTLGEYETDAGRNQ